ncbi:hypothetical protein EX895_000053 [Sporisorium graminicola]|uniref:YCII-related domain-containing protein n=1 Tax=Sporisorium graminicola TaxID=280036 RepID=A0A4U7KYV5_9BASI|nr:hypothetical protein EX895_000053 [Sporisorium graminicola]TKY90055.1 hypothetical protein EX895_000053 [Sporisorium graminicola]
MSLFRATSSALRLTGRRTFTSASTLGLAAAAGPAETNAGPWADRPSAPRLNRYLVVAEDFSDAGANARRFEVRERHLEQAQNGKRVGRIELGGALLRKDFHEIDEELGPGPHMGGSVLVVLGESLEDVRARVMQDEYVQGAVWDVEKIKIYPLLQAPLKNAAADAVDAATAESNAARAGGSDANATLGQLRQDLAAGKGHKMVTLGALRRMHQSVERSD